MSTENNKEVVGRWFKEFWGNPWNPEIVDELAAPDILLQYSLHAPRRGRDDVRAFMVAFRDAFPDLNFWGTADLIAEGDYVVGRWEGASVIVLMHGTQPDHVIQHATTVAHRVRVAEEGVQPFDPENRNLSGIHRSPTPCLPRRTGRTAASSG